jgi:hypothetical protein
MKPAEVDAFAFLCEALTLEDGPGLLALSVLDPATGEFLEHCQLCRNPRYKATWDTLYANELGHLCQGIGAGSTPSAQPLHKRKEVCHTMVVCEVRPDKDDPDCTHITIGGNHICFPGNVGTNTTLLELVKLLLNSVLSQKGIDLKNFYLDTPMPDPEYVRIKISDIQAEFIEEYNITVMAGSTLKFARDVMVFPNQASWPTISFAPASRPKVTTKRLPLLVSGTTNGNNSNSASLSMTLVLNTWVSNTSFISWTSSRNITGCNSTWQVTSLPVLTLNGTMLAGAAASVCQGTSTISSSNSNIPCHPSCAACHTNACLLPMGPKPS